MLIRMDGQRAILISQPAHAALSGQLARAWGSPLAGPVEPFDAVCLGAQLHDIGWVEWERAPTLNDATGLPHTFLQLPTRTHLDIWGSAPGWALAFGRYPALLTSMHFTGLYERFHDYERDNPDDARDARALVARELAFQRDMLSALRADAAAARFATDELVARNRQLVALWDGMSLAICHGVTEPRTFRGVPGSNGTCDLVLAPVDGDLSVDPWPFVEPSVSVSVDGRVLNDRCRSQLSLDDALDAAFWTTIETTLVPAT
jgi:hypothetical protein